MRGDKISYVSPDVKFDTLPYCSRYCEDKGIPVIGSARNPVADDRYFGGFILVEYPKTWEERIERQEGILGDIASVLSTIKSQTGIIWRLQAIQRRSSSAPTDNYHLILYRNIAENTIELVRENYHAPNSVTIFKKLLLQPLQQYMVDDQIKRDILLCTHAQRDRCCGRFGYPIYKYLSDLDLDKVQVWRSSHIGGHRMAPTMVDLPSGMFWGYLDQQIATKVVRKFPFSEEEIKHHFRGMTGLAPDEQVVDREGFVKHGERWFDHSPRITRVEEDNSTLIKVHRGKLDIEKHVTNQPQIITPGKNRCHLEKSIIHYEIISGL